MKWSNLCSTFLLLLCCYFTNHTSCHSLNNTVESIEDMALLYEDDKNSMIAVSVKERTDLYEEFYDEMDNRLRLTESMNMIYFGPPNSFLRIDAESILHMLTYTKKHLIPISRTLLIWDILTDGKGPGYLQGREYLALGSLLNVVPEEDLYHVNFGNPSVIRHFADNYVDLQPRKLGILAAAYKRYYGDNWYENSTYINELGYLICGFPSTELQKISPSTFKELDHQTLNKVGKCNLNQTKTFYRIAIQREAYGEPYKWSSHELRRLCTLFKCIPERDISSIQLEAVTAIRPEVMALLHQHKLEYFTKSQVLRMTPKTRRIFILRMQLRHSYDMSDINNRQIANRNKSHILTLLVNIVTLVLINGNCH